MTIRQQTVSYLLLPPASVYLKELQERITQDPSYLETNREDIGNILRGFLSGGGFHWLEEIFQREWPGILEEALGKLD